MMVISWLLLLFQLFPSPGEKVERITVREGLQSNYVKHIFIDNESNAWVSTDFGLSLIRGNRIDNFNFPFSSAFVKYVYRDFEGRLFVVANADYYEILKDGATYKFESVVEADVKPAPNSLELPNLAYVDSLGFTWVSQRRKFAKLKNGTIEQFEIGERAQTYSVYRNFLFQNGDKNHVLITSQPGLFWWYDHINEELTELSPSTKLSASFNIEALYRLDSNRFLIGSDLGVYEATIKGTEIDLRQVLDLRQVIDIIDDKYQNKLLFATKSEGIYRVSHNGKSFQTEEMISSIPKIKTITYDDEGNLWVGSDEGVSVISSQLFAAKELSLFDSFVGQSILVDDNTFIVSSKSTVYKLKVEGGVPHFKEIGNIENAQITALAWDGNQILIGTLSGMIYSLNEGDKPEMVSKYSSAVSQLIWNGDLFVLLENSNVLVSNSSAGKGVFAYGFPSSEDAVFKEIAKHPETNQIFGIVGSEDIRLVKINSDNHIPEVISTITPRIQNQIFDVRDFQIGLDNSVWVATTQGILRFNLDDSEHKAEWVSSKSDFQYQLIEDMVVDENRLWIGAQNGLFLLDEEILTAYAKDDGIHRDQVTSISLSPSGMVLGHVDGLSFWNSDVIGKSKTYIGIDVQSANNKVGKDQDRILRIGSDESQITIVPKSFPTSHVVLFWRQGNDDWKHVPITNVIPVSELQTGLQTLFIKAVKSGYTVSHPMKFRLYVTPIWYQSIWFMVLVFAAVVALIFFFLRFRKVLSSQKNAVISLRETREQIQAIIQSSPVFLISISNDEKIQFLEGKALSSLHVEGHRYVGNHISMLFADNHFKVGLNKAFSGQSIQLVVDRNSRSYDMHLIPIYKGNKVQTVNGIGVDITSLVMIERELRLAKDESEKARLEAERANRAKSQFLANMSHELRTPLNAIIGYAQILEADQELSTRQHQFIKTMQSSGYHLLGMINDILDLSKIESGNLELNLDVFSLKSVVTDLDSMFQIQAQNKGLNFSIELANSVPERVEGDEHKIRQVLLNLISNAIKYTETGFVELHISVGDSTPDHKGRTKIKFTVSDSGRGIPEEQLTSIFRPFRQVQGQFNTGTGLGLTITKNLTELMEGEITTQSGMGKGSKFSLIVPLKPVSHSSESREGQRTQLRTTQGVSAKVLVVDDIKSNRELLTELLSTNGFTVKQFSDGKEALVYLTNNKADLVLLDLNMPGLKGEEVLSVIRNDISKSLPVIAVTAQGFYDSKEHLKSMGFNDYISKPFLWKDLLESIHLVTNGKFTEKEQKNGLGNDFEVPVEIPLHFIQTLSNEEKSQWRDALELIDLNGLEVLSRNPKVPNEIRTAIAQRDYKYLLSLDEEFDKE